MTKEKDYYGILHVSPAATSAEIKDAYRMLISALHPDKFQNDQKRSELANKITKEINEAFNVLKDPEKRAEYDRNQRHQSEYDARDTEARVRGEYELKYSLEIAKLKQEYHQRLNQEIQKITEGMEAEIHSRVTKLTQTLNYTNMRLLNEVRMLRANGSSSQPAPYQPTNHDTDPENVSMPDFIRVVISFLKGETS